MSQSGQQQSRKVAIQGFILLDKPEGVTSRRCVDIVRKVLGGVKAGHSGTLDPFATGLLPVCLGRATRLVEFLRTGEKTYEAVLRLGYRTDTEDLTGQILERQPLRPDLDLNLIREVAVSLLGVRDQAAPMYSARKVDGVRLYKLARKNIEVERKPKRITISAFDIRAYQPPDVHFCVTCSEGTYVRSLGGDLARLLGTAGTLHALRRTRIGRFSVDQAVPVDILAQSSSEDIVKHWIQHPLSITSHLPSITLKPDRMERFLKGCQLMPDDVNEPINAMGLNSFSNLFDSTGAFLAVVGFTGRAEDGKSILKTIRLTDIDR